MFAFLLFLFCFFFQSIQIVIEKYLFVKYRKTPYDTLLYEGLFGVIFIMCFAVFLYVYPCPTFMKKCNVDDKYFNFLLNSLDSLTINPFLVISFYTLFPQLE